MSTLNNQNNRLPSENGVQDSIEELSKKTEKMAKLGRFFYDSSPYIIIGFGLVILANVYWHFLKVYGDKDMFHVLSAIIASIAIFLAFIYLNKVKEKGKEEAQYQKELSEFIKYKKSFNKKIYQPVEVKSDFMEYTIYEENGEWKLYFYDKKENRKINL